MTCDQHNIIYAADDTCPACDERERIIKLLKDSITDECPDNWACPNCKMAKVFIALIKGEQK